MENKKQTFTPYRKFISEANKYVKAKKEKLVDTGKTVVKVNPEIEPK